MEESELGESERFLSELKDIFSVSAATDFLYQHHIGIVIILEYIKAKDWPWKRQSLVNEPIGKIPLVWAVFDATDSNRIRMVWDIHPAKCFPQRYNLYNPNSQSTAMPVVKEHGATLAGCSRTFVTISNRRYEVNEKTPEYCSIFGLPDDCYDPDFEKRMIHNLTQYNGLELWCFERTEYIAEQVESLITLHYMKGEFLPSRYFMYVDTPEHFLKGIFGTKELENLSSQLWYSSGKELIEEMNLDNKDFCFRFEEQASYYVRKRLIYEFVRLLLLLINKESFSSFGFISSPELCLDNEQEIQSSLANILNTTKKDKELYVHGIMSKISRYIDFRSFKNSRFMVMDVEYIHVPYPTGSTARLFNFPSIFSSIIWQGAREGLTINTNVFIIPCHFCAQPCDFFKKKVFNYNCLAHGFEFIEKQASLVEEMLSKYERFKIYTYGRSDIFQLEQASSFFSDSFEIRRYERRNRKRTQRIVDVLKDLSVPDKRLSEIEDEILEKWLNGWSREEQKVHVSPRFMTQYSSSNWETNYSEAINSCMLDTISAFLYLLYEKYRASDSIIKFA